jgi:chromosome partitioning protein
MERKMRTITVINQKRSVAKTTTTAILTHALVLNQHKVTVNDLDPQGHLSTNLTVNFPIRQGLSYLIGTFKNFGKLGHKISELFMTTLFNTRCRLPQKIVDTFKQYFQIRVLAARIRATAALAECPYFGKTI